MNDADTIATKIAKLLALADKAGTAEEAANALGHAQRLAEIHGITAERVAAAEALRNGSQARPDEPMTSAIVFTYDGSAAPTWIGWVGIAVAECNRGAVRYGHAGGRRVLIAHGTASDIAVMAAILPAITHQINRLCDEWVAADATRGGRSSRDSYRKGAAETVARRLREAVAEARKALEAEAAAERPVFALPAAGSGDAAEVGPSTALVLVRAAIDSLDVRGRDAIKAMQIATGRPNAKKAYSGSSRDGASDQRARREGQRDGHRVALGGNKSITGGRP